MTEPYYADATVTVWAGDCLDVLPTLPDNSVDCVVTDPPYGLAEHKRKDVEAALLAWLTGDRARVPSGPGGFMGRKWDRFVPPPAVWDECFRVLKPGGHLLAFAGSRTYDLMGMSIRLAGLTTDVSPEIRDSIAWLYGSGFPKSLAVDKAIDRQRDDREPTETVRAWLDDQRRGAGITLSQINAHFGLATNGGGNAANWTTHPTNINVPAWEQWLELKQLIGFGDAMDAEVWRLNGRKGTPGDNWDQREALGRTVTPFKVDQAVKRTTSYNPTGKTITEDGYRYTELTAPATPEAAQWQGWGTALKPAFEPVVVARKPLVGTVAANVLQWGTGALHIDATRINSWTDVDRRNMAVSSQGQRRPNDGWGLKGTGETLQVHASGRWPANVCLDESQAAALDQMSGETASTPYRWQPHHSRDRVALNAAGDGSMRNPEDAGYSDSGGASRYFKVVSTTLDEWEPPGERSTKGASTSAGKTTENTGSDSHTGGSGNRPTDPSHPDTTFITATETPSITTCPTCNSLLLPSIGNSTAETARTTASSPASSTGVASDATSTCSCQSSESAPLALGRATAESANSTTSASGGTPTASTTTPTCAPIAIGSLDSRFYYTAKAGSDERITHNGVSHPTVKPLSLMRWLVRLVCPPGGVILDPFAGSGTTVEAAIMEGFRCIAVERGGPPGTDEAEYLPLITQRINRRRDPIAYIKAAGEDLGLFGDDDEAPPQPQGRWPANVVLDRSQAEALDQMSGERRGFASQNDLTPQAGTDGTTTYGKGVGVLKPGRRQGFDDDPGGGASRFFKVVDEDEDGPDLSESDNRTGPDLEGSAASPQPPPGTS